MKRRIAVFTGTRAEYGLLHWLMRDIRASKNLGLQIIAGGAHLSPEFGETWKEIEADGFAIDAKVEMLLSSNTAIGVVKSMGVGLIGFADAIDRLKPDLLVVLGDRFEALAIVQSALIMRVPVAHVHGGEVTEGAYDDAIRHAITKMSNLHFTAAEIYRQRVIQMGESPDKVFNVGALGLDHLSRSALLNPAELSVDLDFDLSRPYVVLTYHPATLGAEDPEESFRSILEALESFPDCSVVMTYPNADNGGRSIIALIEDYVRERSDRVKAVRSLGFRRYMSLLRGAVAAIGNSSSGIIEAPAFGVPTVDIGIRQRGRLSASSVIHCEPEVDAVRVALLKAMSPQFASASREVVNPYGRGNAAGQIVAILETTLGSYNKTFHDLTVPR